jgi:hypothetical protein
MSHVFMYPRVSQIAPRAHTVRASWLGTAVPLSAQPAPQPPLSRATTPPNGRAR